MKKRILVIDDDKNMRSNISALLSEEGYIVSCSKNGIEGVRMAKEENPDLVLCDIMMDGVDGYGVFKKLSDDYKTRSIPFIFLTAKAEREDIRKGMKLGADDYVLKPFDAEDLLRSIEARLHRIHIFTTGKIDRLDKPGEPQYLLDDNFIVQVKNYAHVLKIRDIVYISAAKQYTTLTMSDKKTYLIRKSLNSWDEILPEKTFLRVHRCTIININYIRKMETWSNSGYVIYLENVEEPVLLSRRYVPKLKGILYK